MPPPREQSDRQHPRKIRSFVRREGRITPSQQQALESLWPNFGIDFSNNPDSMYTAFPRPAPLSLDIGFGNGISTLKIAADQPDWNHLGIEVHRPGVGRLLAQLKAQNISNVRVICADAVEVMNQMVVDASIDRILIFFPDPWPKKRHHKRRLIQSDFVQLVSKKIKPGGQFHLATDWQPYAEWMLEVMAMEKGFVNLAGAGSYSLKPDYRPQTKFELRGHKLGHEVFDLVFERV